MNKLISAIALLMMIAFHATAHAATVKCQTVARANEEIPPFHITFKTHGAALEPLYDVQAWTDGRDLAFNVLSGDADYNPRIPGRGRFAFDMEPTSFNGIIHGVIMPESIPAGAYTFVAQLISSTDSYHDGIYSYFKMVCSVGQ